jgi:pimeloyl-ACP methyl ester carboxylesterase
MAMCPGWLAALLLSLLVQGAAAQSAASAVSSDPPQDRQHPASMQVVHIPSHGSNINGVLYLAAGADAHPTVILFNGLPGNEQNLDLAQAIRRAGWSVLTLHFRGSWGSPGNYSYHHMLEDARAALEFVRDPHNASRYALDSRRIVLAGHSTGGFLAAHTAADSRDIAGLILISASDDAGEALSARSSPAAWRQWVQEDFGDSMESLSTATPEGLARELLASATSWSFAAIAPRLQSVPLLVITADDGLAAEGEALAAAVQRFDSSQPARIRRLHLATDHPYSDQRIALETAVVSWLLSDFGEHE